MKTSDGQRFMVQQGIRSRVCVSVGQCSIEACEIALRDLDFAEIRLDLIENLSLGHIPTLFGSGTKTIATCRPGKLTQDERIARLCAAIEAGATLVDIEWESPKEVQQIVLCTARKKGCEVIVSHHQPKFTPSREVLQDWVERCFSAGGDIAKIACHITTPKDAARLLGLLDDDRRLIVVGLGPQGTKTRVMAPLLGAQFTYASLQKGLETAPGQLDKRRLERYLLAMMSGFGTIEDEP